MKITKRQALLGAAGLLLTGANRAGAQTLLPHEQELYNAAKAEGELTWYSGQLAAEPTEGVMQAFSARYRGIKINVVRATSQVVFQRLSQDMRARTAICDVFSSSDYGHYSFLKDQNVLMQFRPVNADGLIEQLKVADPDNYYQTSYMGLYMLAYNTQKVSDAEAPKAWRDVLEPRWKGQLAVGHPAYSGAIGVWAVQIRKMYKWDYFAALERNSPLIGRSSQDPVTALNAGERSVGVAVPMATTLRSISRGNPLKLVYPEDGALLTASPSAIMKNAPHPRAAKLFMEFITGPDYSAVVRRFHNEVIHASVPSPEGARPMAEVKMVAPTQEEAERQIPEVREQWRDTFGI